MWSLISFVRNVVSILLLFLLRHIYHFNFSSVKEVTFGPQLTFRKNFWSSKLIWCVSCKLSYSLIVHRWCWMQRSWHLLSPQTWYAKSGSSLYRSRVEVEWRLWGSWKIAVVIDYWYWSSWSISSWLCMSAWRIEIFEFVPFL